MVTKPAAPRVLGDLSNRELEVVHCASLGMTNAQIAKELSVSSHAVKFHLASIYRKLGVANRTEATARYVGSLAGAGAYHPER